MAPFKVQTQAPQRALSLNKKKKELRRSSTR